MILNVTSLLLIIVLVLFVGLILYKKNMTTTKCNENADCGPNEMCDDIKCDDEGCVGRCIPLSQPLPQESKCTVSSIGYPPGCMGCPPGGESICGFTTNCPKGYCCYQDGDQYMCCKNKPSATYPGRGFSCG